MTKNLKKEEPEEKPLVCDPRIKLPFTVRKVVTINNSLEFPPFTYSGFYRDDKYYCINFYKPVSQLSKLV
ncbi:MAG: hypothetical protein JNM88_12325 [Chitinophagaceae bacterium]|nr:hypothetical protein [Chitinophagaceae bacterium]